jgi:acyl-CoA thioester hydrolase
MKFEYKLEIKEHHLDTFGHVNNATYLALYEEARWDFIQTREYGLDVILKEKKGPVILEANIKFKRELKNREVITIETDGQWIKGKIMGLSQRMINGDGKVCSEVALIIGFMSFEQRKLITPSSDWLKACGLE